ncbi:MAG: ATP-binding protein [Acidobacteria bacterium]|nr:ATP-binding protein [Acidobacteriota bacterium]
MGSPASYIPRLADAPIAELLGEVPAIMLLGPRATGKTTTARRFARSVVRLDSEVEAVAFRADPDAALRGLDEPVLLDEWQAVPGVLAGVKRAVDDEPRPGRYLLTGSVRGDVEAPTWPGTGRLIRLTMYGLTVREAARSGGRALIARVRESGIEGVSVPRDPPDLRGYVELALRGGFPEMVEDLSPATRSRWITSYVDQMVTRDAKQADEGRDPVRLRRYLEALAIHTGCVVEDRTLYEAAGINRKTAAAYERLLRNLIVLEALPAWTSSRLKRLTRGAKRHLVDPSLVAGALGVDPAGVMRDGVLLGRVLETFVVSQIRAEAALEPIPPRLYHLRAEQGRHEVDLVAEFGAGDLIAVEVKADAAPRAGAARHLAWLRDAVGERFLAGLVLHTGTHVYELGRLIWAVPVCALWSP